MHTTQCYRERDLERDVERERGRDFLCVRGFLREEKQDSHMLNRKPEGNRVWQREHVFARRPRSNERAM